ncbi:MAG: DUF2800 domain-containing protein [Lachnospiraceae bacterium]|nr:DUF2800 domain-containing protein [Lachnospiraceae bacterium]
MAAHSEKGPSSSSRWIHCPPSAKLCAGLPDSSSSFAKEGTDAHALCEYLLNTAVGRDSENPVENLTYYNSEMQECAEGYRDYCMELNEQAKQSCKDPVLLVEQKIQYERFVKGGFGTADCIILADGTLNVVDFKYGMGVEVSAKGNTQMRIYALGALEIFDALYDINKVQMTIYQPRKQNVSVDEISRDELYQWAEQVLKPAAIAAEEGTGEYDTGEWCRFCKAKQICRKRAEKNLELASYDFAPPPTISDTEIVVILEKVDALVAWANDMKEYALQEAISGKEWAGMKLVEGRSVRKYVNEQAVAAAVIKAGFEAYDKKLFSITEMQKQLGKKKFEEILGKLVVKPQGKPVLVREDDKRPALSTAKDDFKEENEHGKQN